MQPPLNLLSLSAPLEWMITAPSKHQISRACKECNLNIPVWNSLECTASSKQHSWLFPNSLKFNERNLFVSLYKYTFLPHSMANNCIYPYLKFHRVPTYPAGNLNQRENPSLKTPGYKVVRNEICSSIPATPPAHRFAHPVLCVPAHRAVQGWVLPSPEYFQVWGPPNLSGNLFYYFTTLIATIFSLQLIWIYQVPACACCLSFFCSPLGRAGLCLTTVKCNGAKKHEAYLHLQPQEPQILHIKVDQSKRGIQYKLTKHIMVKQCFFRDYLPSSAFTQAHKISQLETQNYHGNTLLVLPIYSNSQILECGWFWIVFQHSQVMSFLFFPSRNTLAHGICYLGQWPHSYSIS